VVSQQAGSACPPWWANAFGVGRRDWLDVRSFFGCGHCVRKIRDRSVDCKFIAVTGHLESKPLHCSGLPSFHHGSRDPNAPMSVPRGSRHPNVHCWRILIDRSGHSRRKRSTSRWRGKRELPAKICGEDVQAAPPLESHHPSAVSSNETQDQRARSRARVAASWTTNDTKATHRSGAWFAYVRGVHASLSLGRELRGRFWFSGFGSVESLRVSHRPLVGALDEEQTG
jgi:hypothetical protein